MTRESETATAQAAITAAIAKALDVPERYSAEVLMALAIHREDGYGAIVATTVTMPSGQVDGAVHEFEPLGSSLVSRRPIHWPGTGADAGRLAIELAGWSGVEV